MHGQVFARIDSAQPAGSSVQCKYLVFHLAQGPVVARVVKATPKRRRDDSDSDTVLTAGPPSFKLKSEHLRDDCADHELYLTKKEQAQLQQMLSPMGFSVAFLEDVWSDDESGEETEEEEESYEEADEDMSDAEPLAKNKAVPGPSQRGASPSLSRSVMEQKELESLINGLPHEQVQRLIARWNPT